MSARKDGVAVAGVGAVACVACCTGPILGLLGAIGLGTVTGVLVFGIVGLLVTTIGIAVFTVRRRRRNTACTAGSEVVAVEMPTRGEPRGRSSAGAVMDCGASVPSGG